MVLYRLLYGGPSRLRWSAALLYAGFGAIMLLAAPVAAVFLLSLPADAAQNKPSIVVRDDPGGDVAQRVALIEKIRRSGQLVEIRGGYCMSSCTMYLGLQNTCVVADVKFGFHGPGSSRYGIALPPNEFEYWSAVMGSYYPASLRSWYMETGRMITVGFFEMSGRDLVRMGVSECA
jgi:hypothetical protein